MAARETVLVIYCHVVIYSNAMWLKTNIYHHIGSMHQKFGSVGWVILAQETCEAAIRCWLELQSFGGLTEARNQLECPIHKIDGKGPLLFSISCLSVHIRDPKRNEKGRSHNFFES